MGMHAEEIYSTKSLVSPFLLEKCANIICQASLIFNYHKNQLFAIKADMSSRLSSFVLGSCLWYSYLKVELN